MVDQLLVITPKKSFAVNDKYPRPDVFKNLNVPYAANEENINIGFRFKAEVASGAKIYAQVKNDLLLIIDIEENKNIEHPMVLKGSDGYLFLKGDSNRLIDQMTGIYKLAENWESNWKRTLHKRRDSLSSVGIKYLLAIIPNKESVYSDFLPSDVIVSGSRPVHKLLKVAEECGVNALYPLNNFKQKIDSKSLYSKGDTHWDLPGAYIGYSLIMRDIGIDPMPEDQISYKTINDTGGDLSSKIGVDNTRVIGRINNSQHKLVHDNKIPGVGGVVAYEGGANDLRIVIFHDSFGNYLKGLFAASFKNSLFVWQPNIDYGILEEYKPDIVVNIQCERFLVLPPDDIGGPSNRDYVAQKLAGSKQVIGESKALQP